MSDNAMHDEVDRGILVWAINKVGWVDSFTGEPLDAKNAVTFEIKAEGGNSLVVMTGENYDKVRHILEQRFEMEDFIDGRNL